MQEVSSSVRPIVRFGVFELDLRSGELRKSGVRVKLADQPFRVLAVLLEHPGELVTRDELRSRVWPADTFVDFEHGLNAAIKRLRDAVGDSAESPRYIETVPKRGYRFIGPVDGMPAPPHGAGQLTEEKARAARQLRWMPSRAVMKSVAVCVAAAMSVAWWWWARREPTPQALETSRQLTRLTFDPGLQTDPTFSPDGQFIAYASNKSGNFDVWMQPVAGGPVVQLTSDPADDTQPDWSPDGRSIAFRSERAGGGIFVLSPTDRHVERLTRAGYLPRWSPDGSKLAFAGARGVEAHYYVAAADSTSVTRITLPTQEERGFTIAGGWHPSGRLVFLHGGGSSTGVTALEPGASAVIPRHVAPAVRDRFVALSLIVESGQPLAPTPDGRSLYFVGDANGVKDIWRLTLNPTSLDIVNGPERVTTSAGWNVLPTMSRTGARLAFGAHTASQRVWLFALEDGRRLGSAAPLAVTPPELNAAQPALAPDGRSLVVVGNRPGARRQLSLMLIPVDDPTRPVTLRTIDGEIEDMAFPRWSPDGTTVAYSYRRPPQSDKPPTYASSIRLVDVRTGQESAVTSKWISRIASVDNPWGWSADRRSLLASGDRYSPRGFTLVRLALSGAPHAERTARTLVSSDTHGFWQATESPDGRWVCVNKTSLKGPDSSSLHIIPAQGGEPRPLLDDTSWDDKPRWSADGRIIYFVSRRGGTINVWGLEFDTLQGRAVGPPFQITHSGAANSTLRFFDRIAESELSISGDRMVLPLQTLSGGIWMLH